MNKESHFSLLSLLFSYVFILLELVIILQIPSSNGYEISIYGAYPSFFWVLMVSSMCMCITNIVLSAIYNTKYWTFSLLAIFFNYFILLFLPTIRGYAFFAKTGYDLFSHLAMAKIILDSGHLLDTLFYPVTHILVVYLYYFTGLPLNLCGELLNFIFSTLYILFLLVLGKQVLTHGKDFLFMLAFASPPMFSFLHHSLIPFYFGICFIPLFLYFFHKRVKFENKMEYYILMLIVSFCIIFIHPLIGIISFIILVLFYFFFYLLNKNLSKKPNIIILIEVIIVAFLSWYLNFSNILTNIGKIVDAIFDAGHSTILDSQLHTVSSSNASFSLIIEILVKTYGPIMLYLGISFIGLIFILQKFRVRKAEDIEVIYSIQFVGSLLFCASLIIGYLIIFETMRAVSFMIVTSTVFSSIFVSNYLKNVMPESKKKMFVGITIIIICTACVIGIFNVYESPARGLPNPQLSHMNMDGLDWFLKHQNYSVPLLSNLNSIYKYERYHNSIYNSKYVYNVILMDMWIPSHFGYGSNESLEDTLGPDPKYIITSEPIKQFSSGVLSSERYKYPEYLEADFKKLNNDVMVTKIYVNGEFDVWSLNCFNVK